MYATDRIYYRSIVGPGTSEIQNCSDIEQLREWHKLFDLEISKLNKQLEETSHQSDSQKYFRLSGFIKVQKTIRAQLINRIHIIKGTLKEQRDIILLKRSEKTVNFLKYKLIELIGQDAVFSLLDDFTQTEEYRCGYTQAELDQMAADAADKTRRGSLKRKARLSSKKENQA